MRGKAWGKKEECFTSPVYTQAFETGGFKGYGGPISGDAGRILSAARLGFKNGMAEHRTNWQSYPWVRRAKPYIGTDNLSPRHVPFGGPNNSTLRRNQNMIRDRHRNLPK